MKNLLIITFLLFTITACDKFEIVEEDNQFEYNPIEGPNGNNTLNGLITIMSQKAYKPLNPSSGNHLYSVVGNIKDGQYGVSTSNTINAGDLVLNTDTVNKDTSNYWSDYNYVNGSNLFGNTINVSLTGNPALSINQTSTSLTLPNELELLSNSAKKTISKSNNNDFYWTPDANYNGKVYVKVTYKATMSNEIDPSLPDNYIVFSDEVNDSQGSYTLTSTNLSNFPVGGVIDITLGRSTYQTLNTGSHEILIAGASITYSNFDLTQ